MADVKTFVRLALFFEGAVEAVQFEKRSFRLHKRIFTTLDEVNNRAVLKFSLLINLFSALLMPQLFIR